jgi:Flp pilus assembly pilin Flp
MSLNEITIENEEGQTMAEYAVVLGVITGAIVFSISILSGAIGAMFEWTFGLIDAIA